MGTSWTEAKGQQVGLFIDWLGLTLRMISEPQPIPGHQWRDYSATNVWERRQVLWNEHGDRVCTLLSKPRSSIISSNQALLEIDNQWLYHGSGTQFILDLLTKSFFYEVIGISRLDLAVDFVPNAIEKDIILGLATDKYYVGGKRNGSGFWSTNSGDFLHPDWRGRKIPHCQSWGHKTSAIKWKLYYKTKELYDALGGHGYDKPYIVDQWRCLDFDISNVWRLEVSMKHLNDYNLYGRHIGIPELEAQRADIFLSMYNSRFQISRNEHHVDRTNDTRVPFLPLTDALKHVTKAPPRSEREHHGRITLLRHLITSLDDEHILLDKPSRTDVLEHIEKLIKRDHLENYFRAITGKWYADFVNSIEECAMHTSNEEKVPSSRNGCLEIPNYGQRTQIQPNLQFDDNQQSPDSYKPNPALQWQLDWFNERIKKLHP